MTDVWVHIEPWTPPSGLRWTRLAHWRLRTAAQPTCVMLGTCRCATLQLRP